MSDIEFCKTAEELIENKIVIEDNAANEYNICYQKADEESLKLYWKNRMDNSSYAVIILRMLLTEIKALEELK